MEVLIASEQTEEIKERLKALMNDRDGTHGRKRKVSWFIDIRSSLEELSDRLKKELSVFEEDLCKKLPRLGAEQFEELKIKLATLRKVSMRKATFCNLVKRGPRGERDRFVVELLKFLYGEEVLNPEVFKSEWSRHTSRVFEIAKDCLDQVKRLLLEAYKAAFPEPNINNMVAAKVDMAYDCIEKPVLSSLQKYAENHGPRGKNILQILHTASQESLFGQLPSVSEESVSAAILQNMQQAINDALTAIVKEPSECLQSMDKEVESLEDSCEKGYDKVLRTFTRLGNEKNSNLFRRIIANMREDVDTIKNRLCGARHGTAQKWIPLRTIPSGPISTSSSCMLQGTLIEPSFNTRPGISQFYRPRVRCHDAGASDDDGFDPQGLYKCLFYAK